MRRNTILIVLLVTTVLLPMWYVALHGEPPSEEIAIDESVTDLRPLEGPIDTPNKLSPSQVGVVVWVALFGLVGVLAGAHQFMNRAVRPPEEAPVADGGQLTASLPWLESEHRWVVEYHDASDAVEAPALATDDDYETLAARYNDLFELGYSEYTDRTDGSLDSSGPPVPLYESKYRPDQSWNDVNLDLARAYDHYGLEIDQDRRDNHDALRYELEFAGYLARREAVVGEDAALARLDFQDRHLGHAAAGVADRLADEPGTDLYGSLGEFLGAFVRADRNDLADRLEGVR